MAIAAHIDNSTGNASFLWQLISRLAVLHPGEHFVIFTNKKEKDLLQPPANCQVEVIKPAIKNYLLRYYWYQYKLPNVIEQFNIRFFLSEFNTCNGNLTTPQALIINAIPTTKNKRKLKYFSKSLAKASTIIAATVPLYHHLINEFNADISKTILLYPGVSNQSVAASESEQEQVRSVHTNGHEYFLYKAESLSGAESIKILKAFSIFKRRLKSAMRLVILQKEGAEPIPDFKNYKYRSEVLIITEGPAATAIEAAAYAAIYLPQHEQQTNAAMHFLKAGIPLIISDQSFTRITYKAAARYTSSSEKEIAEHIMLLYKDENIRRMLIEEGLKLSSDYNWETSAAKLGESIFPAGSI